MSKANRSLTPGMMGTVKVARNVTAADKKRVFELYGIWRIFQWLYRIDHLVPLELCGTNSIPNLWPQLIGSSKAKDREENALATAVRKGRMTLLAAQEQMIQEWSE